MTDREKVINDLQDAVNDDWMWQHANYYALTMEKAIALLKEQEAVVHPESSCEMTYITNCCCDLCGVQLIREDNFCRCCGKPLNGKAGEVDARQKASHV